MKNNLHFKINKAMYEWHEQYITGAEVKQLGEIPENEILFLEIKNPWEDELIENETRVDLARPGIERFYSKSHDENLSFNIFVNGKEREWNSRTISYEEVIKLVYPDYADISSQVYTVTYTDGPGQNPQGSMVKGDKVVVKNKMKFNVTATNQS